MATKVQAVRFDKANKNNIKDGHKRTRSGAYKSKTRQRAHGKLAKHK